jgi:hypothetical protein
MKLMRRYKYLEKMFEDEMKKILIFIKGFTELERIKLARMTALWISNGSVPPTVLLVLINVGMNLFVVMYCVADVWGLNFTTKLQHCDNFCVVHSGVLFLWYL